MEDNEFEEVTIISHTDQAASILPQQTAERLMKEIRMEVTQKISQTENVKMGSLQHSETSKLLDKIQTVVLKPIYKGYASTEHLNFMCRSQDKDMLLLGTNNIFYCFEYKDKHDPVLRFTTAQEICCKAVVWHEHIFVFAQYKTLRRYHLQTFKQEIGRFTYIDNRLDGPLCSDKHLYYLSNNCSVIVIDDQFREEVLIQPDSVLIRDWLLRAKDNVLVTIGLDCIALIFPDRKIKSVHPRWNQGEICLIKQMYSDHFLVGSKDRTSLNLHLVDAQTLQHQSCLNTARIRKRPDLMRLAGVSRGSQLFMVVAGGTVGIGAVLVNRKLIFVSVVEVPVVDTRIAYNAAQNTWLVGGPMLELYAITVHFPDALKL